MTPQGVSLVAPALRFSFKCPKFAKTGPTLLAGGARGTTAPTALGLGLGKQDPFVSVSGDHTASKVCARSLQTKLWRFWCRLARGW